VILRELFRNPNTKVFVELWTTFGPNDYLPLLTTGVVLMRFPSDEAC
jgi:hypothetical protein